MKGQLPGRPYHQTQLPANIFLLGFIKDNVNKTCVVNIDDLKMRIVNTLKLEMHIYCNKHGTKSNNVWMFGKLLMV